MAQRNDDGFGRQIDNYPTIHKMRQGGLPALPFHTKDKPFGMSQLEWEVQFDEEEKLMQYLSEWSWLESHGGCGGKK